MTRIVIIGNAGRGKSTLARKLAARRTLRRLAIATLLRRAGWVLTPDQIYADQHDAISASDDWVIDGLGQRASIADRIARSPARLYSR